MKKEHYEEGWSKWNLEQLRAVDTLDLWRDRMGKGYEKKKIGMDRDKFQTCIRWKAARVT